MVGGYSAARRAGISVGRRTASTTPHVIAPIKSNAVLVTQPLTRSHTQLRLRLREPTPAQPTGPTELQRIRAQLAGRDGFRPRVSKDLEGVDRLEILNMPKLFREVGEQLPPPPLKPYVPRTSPPEVRFEKEAGLHGSVCVSAGWSHSLLLRDDGVVLGMGSDSHGQLGLGKRLQGRTSSCLCLRARRVTRAVVMCPPKQVRREYCFRRYKLS